MKSTLTCIHAFRPLLPIFPQRFSASNTRQPLFNYHVLCIACLLPLEHMLHEDEDYHLLHWCVPTLWKGTWYRAALSTSVFKWMNETPADFLDSQPCNISGLQICDIHPHTNYHLGLVGQILAHSHSNPVSDIPLPMGRYKQHKTNKQNQN